MLVLLILLQRNSVSCMCQNMSPRPWITFWLFRLYVCVNGYVYVWCCVFSDVCSSSLSLVFFFPYSLRENRTLLWTRLGIVKCGYQNWHLCWDDVCVAVSVLFCSVLCLCHVAWQGSKANKRLWTRAALSLPRSLLGPHSIIISLSWLFSLSPESVLSPLSPFPAFRLSPFAFPSCPCFWKWLLIRLLL